MTGPAAPETSNFMIQASMFLHTPPSCAAASPDCPWTERLMVVRLVKGQGDECLELGRGSC